MHETLPANMHETLPAVYYIDSTIGFHFLHRSCLNRSYGEKLEGKPERILHVLQCVTKLIPKNACCLCYCQHTHWRARMIQDEMVWLPGPRTPKLPNILGDVMIVLYHMHPEIWHTIQIKAWD